MSVVEYVEFNTAPLPLGPETQALFNVQSDTEALQRNATSLGKRYMLSLGEDARISGWASCDSASAERSRPAPSP